MQLNWMEQICLLNSKTDCHHHFTLNIFSPLCFREFHYIARNPRGDVMTTNDTFASPLFIHMIVFWIDRNDSRDISHQNETSYSPRKLISLVFFIKPIRVCFVWQENTPFPSHIINFGNDIQNVYEFIYANFVKCNKLPKQNENDSWERNRKGITVLGTNNICENDGGIHWPKNGTNAENDVTFAETTKPNNDDKLMFDAIFRLFISPKNIFVWRRFQMYGWEYSCCYFRNESRNIKMGTGKLHTVLCNIADSSEKHQVNLQELENRKRLRWIFQRKCTNFSVSK